MGRILGIDYGMKRSGLAWTDPLQLVASGLEALDTPKLKARIHQLVTEENLVAFVLGYPLQLDGSDTDSTEAVRTFATWLEKAFPGREIILWDERFSSRQAKEVMILAGVPKKRRQDKYLINQVSATLILQDYLQNR